MNPYRFELRMDPMTREESAAWSKVEHSFRSAKLVSPRKGFVNRWLPVQRHQQLLERRHREIWLAVGNSLAILAILAVIAFTIWPVFQPASIFTSVLESIFDALTFVIVLIGVSLSFLQGFTLVVWFAIALAFFSLIALWTSLFSRVVVWNR